MCSLLCTCAPLASQGRRRPGCNIRMAVRGRADTCMAGLVAVLDREDTAGTTAAPPRCGRTKIQHEPRPAQRALRHGGRSTARRRSCRPAASGEWHAAWWAACHTHLKEAVRRRGRAVRRPPWRNTLEMNLLRSSSVERSGGAIFGFAELMNLDELGME